MVSFSAAVRVGSDQREKEAPTFVRVVPNLCLKREMWSLGLSIQLLSSLLNYSTQRKLLYLKGDASDNVKFALSFLF